jgi:hypothetical protein
MKTLGYLGGESLTQVTALHCLVLELSTSPEAVAHQQVQLPKSSSSNAETTRSPRKKTRKLSTFIHFLSFS